MPRSRRALLRTAPVLVLLGDPQQLDQPLQGSHPPGTERSAIAHLLGDEATMPPHLGLFLDRTWRLHPDICAFTSDLFSVARHLVRMADELPKPSGERLREYRDSNLDSLKLSIFSPAPIYPPLERVKLQTSLTFLAEQLGGTHPAVTLAHAGKNPAITVVANAEFAQS